MLPQSEIDAIKQEAESYAQIKQPLRVNDYSASTKRIYKAYMDAALKYSTEERQRAKVLVDALNEIQKRIAGSPWHIDSDVNEIADTALNTYNKNKP